LEQCPSGYKWIKQYGITEEEIEQYGIKSLEDSVFLPVHSDNDSLVGYQRRFFDGKRKYRTYGKPIEMSLSMLKGRNGDRLILTEDMVSAIKVSRIEPAVPLFGSHMPLELIIRASVDFKSFGLWLDYDKRKESVKQALNAKQKGFDVTLIFTEKDPKEYSTNEIKEILNEK